MGAYAKFIPLLLAAGLAASCGTDPGTVPDGAAVPVIDSLPAGSRLPRFARSGDRLLLSYVLSDGAAGDRLFVRELGPTGWGSDRELARGTDWFVNWADFPSVRPLGDSLFYHYLAYSGAGTYDYDIRFGVGGGAIGVLHTDGVAAEHGFLSSAALPSGDLRVTWLDGRRTKESSGAMTLRTAVVHPDGSVGEREELDERVCDCCNTATVATEALTMVAYRDRSRAEVRDISYVIRPRAGKWSAPRAVAADGWTVTGCPVNGPALAANRSGQIAVAYYTAAGSGPSVRFARYDAATDRFTEPLVLDAADPLGRLDIKLGDDGVAYVLGLAGGDDSVPVTLWKITDDGVVSERVIGSVAGARSTGFPRLALLADELWVAYTDTGADRILLHRLTAY